ncbi:MAG TPA: hypothetical protein ENJ56_07195 [Anaerolineae bacterium]|nr:hypothetical protein [Anaerolineae bacterium]
MDVKAIMTRIARMLQATLEDESDCSTVYAVMDEVAEAMEAGVDLSESMPDIHHHLKMCKSCHQELEALQNILHAADPV